MRIYNEKDSLEYNYNCYFEIFKIFFDINLTVKKLNAKICKFIKIRIKWMKNSRNAHLK